MAHDAKIDLGLPETRTVVHDLNNDLGIVIAECDLLDCLLKKRSDTAARIRKIKTAARHMADRLSLVRGQTNLQPHKADKRPCGPQH
jgi:hypothetical protein